MKIEAEVLQQRPNGEAPAGAAGFCYLPVLIVDGELTMIEGQKQQTTAKDAGLIANNEAACMLAQHYRAALEDIAIEPCETLQDDGGCDCPTCVARLALSDD